MALEVCFENMAKEFMKLVEERYPSAVRVNRIARDFGFKDDELELKIAFLAQFRDSIRDVDPNIYHSTQHRDEIYKAFIDALEELEEELEELEEEYDEDDTDIDYLDTSYDEDEEEEDEEEENFWNISWDDIDEDDKDE